MESKPAIVYHTFYHIYNRGLNKAEIFRIDQDYSHFLNLLCRYVYPIADVYSYALMSNHFHLAMRIKSENEIGLMVRNEQNQHGEFVKWRTISENPDQDQSKYQKPIPDRMMRHLFNAYTKYFNKNNNRTGKLFEERYERKLISSNNQLRQLIVYINRNPEHHRVTHSFVDYTWTSYQSLINEQPSFLAKERVIELFASVEMFKLAMCKTDFETWLSQQEK